MRWLRLYTEARTDNKLRSLSDAQFRVWFNLLCLAAEQSDRGTIVGYSPHLLAIEAAGGDDTLLSNACNALEALRIVTAVTSPNGDLEIAFLKFAERQFSKPSESREKVRERVSKHRQNKRLANGAENNGNHVTPCNAPVTPPVTPTEPEPEPDTDSELAWHGQAGQRHEPSGLSLESCVDLTRTLFGETAAEGVKANGLSIRAKTGGRWDCVAAAVRQIDRERAKPNAKPVADLVGLTITIAKKYAAGGIPPPAAAPVRVDPPPPVSRAEATQQDRRARLRKTLESLRTPEVANDAG